MSLIEELGELSLACAQLKAENEKLRELVKDAKQVITSPEELAELFHTVYERLAPEYGYATRKETAIPWSDIPADNANKRLMIAVAGEVLARVLLAHYDNSQTAIELLGELAHAPVHVDEYAIQEISCIFCTPYEDEKGRAHHAPTCLVERAKALLEGKL